MYCKNCGANIPDNSAVCPVCSLPTFDRAAMYCRRCGQGLDGHMKYCPRCGLVTTVTRSIHCRTCGTKLGANVMVCPACGATVVKQQERAKAEQDNRNRSRFFIPVEQQPQPNDTTTVGLVILALIFMLTNPVITFLTAGIALSRTKNSGGSIWRTLAKAAIVISVLFILLVTTLVCLDIIYTYDLL